MNQPSADINPSTKIASGAVLMAIGLLSLLVAVGRVRATLLSSPLQEILAAAAGIICLQQGVRAIRVGVTARRKP